LALLSLLPWPLRKWNPVSGYGNAFFVAAAIAGVLAFVAAIVLPALRPEPGTHVSMH
jgi:hypothetical protein